MKRSFPSQLFATFTLLSLALAPLRALPFPAETAEKVASVPDLVRADSGGQAELTFASMHMNAPQALPGPVSEYALRFNLPVGWVPAGTVGLDLELTAFFSSLLPVENSTSVSGLVGGNLSVSLNGSLLGVKTLQQSGDQTLQFEFDSALLTAAARGSYNELRFRWDGMSSCLMNLATNLTILPTSKIKFTYVETPSTLTLNDFPVPFLVENSLQPVPLTVLLPSSPTLGEMRAALIVAAGIGQLSGGASAFKMDSLQAFSAATTANQNVILIAASEGLGAPQLQSLGLTARMQADPGEGIIHLFQRPAGGYGLLLSGDEAGIIRAAQVVSANRVVAAGDTATMIVRAVNPPSPAVTKADMTLQDLGVGEILLTPEAGLNRSFDFFIPAGQAATPDSSFNLIISHSQQLDYLRSGLQIKLNDFPMVSVRLNDGTANQAVFTLILPANLIHAGRNSIEFVAGLNTRDICSRPDATVAWLRVSASSALHLPLERAVTGLAAAKVFKDFPDSFLSGSGLDNVTFVLPRGDLASWQAAATLADELGKALPQSQLLGLRLTWSEAIDPALTRGANLILVGKPSDFKTLADQGEFPSLVFSADNTLSGKSPLAVVPQPAADADVGYLAVRGFVGETDRVLLAVLGSTSTGISLAVDALSSSGVRASNFAVVVHKGVQASWLDQGISTGGAAGPSSVPAGVATEANTASQYKQGMLVWVLPVMAALLVVLILLIYFELRRSFRKDG